MTRSRVVGRGKTPGHEANRGMPVRGEGVPVGSGSSHMAVPGDNLLSGNSGAAPDRGSWVGEPGPPWAPADDEPLRVLLHGGMSEDFDFETYAAEAAASVNRDVEWLVTIQHDEKTRGVGDSLRDFADVRLLPPGPWHRMFWHYYRALRDFRPHVMHSCTRLGRAWAKITGQRWIYSNISEEDVEEAGVTSCVPGVTSDDDLDAAYEVLLAQPVDIMVVTMNQAEVMEKCLAHIAANTWWPHRLVLVDNGSDDGGESLQVLHSFQELYGAEKCVVLESDENLGCPGGRNLAYSDCSSPFIAVLDNDMLVQPGWMNRLMKTMDEEPNAGMVAPWCEVYGPNLRDTEARPLEARASNNLYRAEAVQDAEETPGVFYEEPFASCQGRSDTDLNWRIKEAEWDLWFDGKTRLHHLGGSLVRMCGMTRRHGDGAKMQTGNYHFQRKWQACGKRHYQAEDEAPRGSNIMRLLVGVRNVWWGGIQCWATYLADGLPKTWEVGFVVEGGREAAMHDLAQHGLLLEVPGEGDASQIDRMTTAIAEWDPTVVHGNWEMVCEAAHGLGIPCVTTAHDLPGVHRNGGRYADRAFRVSPAVAGSEPVILNGVARPPQRTRNENEIAYVGRLDTDKQPWVLFEALELLAALRDDFTVKIVGANLQGGFDLDDLALSERLRRVLSLRGLVSHDEAMREIASADMVVASRPEAFGLSTAEGMRAGAIPVVSDEGYGPEMVGGLGIVTPSTPEGIADGLAQALDADHLRARRDEIAARAEDMFHTRRFAREYIEVYEEMAT